METKHTPGPWTVRDEHPNRAALKVIDAQGSALATLYGAPGDPDDQDADGVWHGDHARVANAHLLAAAPQMLAALKSARELLAAVDGISLNNIRNLAAEEIEKLDAAIATATGATQTNKEDRP